MLRSTSPHSAPLLFHGQAVLDEKLARWCEDYLALRRGLGFKLKRHGRFVREFVSALEKREETRITTQRAIEWATEPQHLHPSEWAARLSSVRAFARYWSTIVAATEIPPDGLLPFRPRRANPYLYTENEIQRLLEAARSMPVHFSLQRLTYDCLLGLLAVTGLRISESLNLADVRDVDCTEALLTIRSSKFGKSRLVPLHPTTQKALAEYSSQRNRHFPDRPTAVFFPSKDRCPPGRRPSQAGLLPFVSADWRSRSLGQSRTPAA